MKTRNYKLLIAIILFAISPFGVVKGQVNCATFEDLQAAFADINNGVHTGDVSILLTSDIEITESLTLNASGTNGGSGTADYASVKIMPSDADRYIFGIFDGPLFIFDGADNVTIDGNASTIMQMYTLGTGPTACIAEYKNGAINNYIKSCNIYASLDYTGTGLIMFTTSISGGNTTNTIQNCVLSNSGSGKPIIYSNGTSGNANTGNNVVANSIEQYINPNTSSKAIEILAFSDNWNISTNSFYEGSSISCGDFNYYAIYISNTGGNYRISENKFGGNTVSCGGDPFSISGGSCKWTGIYMSVTTTGTTSEIEKNIFRNIDITSTNSTPFYAIYINEGKVKLSSTGAGSENYIGHTSSSASANGVSITNSSSSSNATSYGIYNKSTVATEIYETQIGNITTVASDSYSHSFIGIYKTGAGTTTINRNYIGSSTISNSINALSSATLGDQNVYGIYCNGSGNVTTTYNTIYNINNNYANTTATAGQVVGIFANSGINTIQNNTITNLSTTSPSDGKTTTTASAIGISMGSSGAGQVVSSNVISGLINNNSTAGRSVGVFGICYAGGTSGTNKINGNFIHSLNIGTDEASSEISGIRIESGTSTYSNNIINLGGSVTAGCLIHGIFENGAAGNNNNIYSNTMYIEGTESGGSNTYCLFNNANTNIRNFRNNLLFNARDGSVNHYAIKIEGISNLTINYNDYFTTGSGGIPAYINGSDANDLTSIQTATGQDANSVSNDPIFNTPGGLFSYNYYPKATTIDGIAIIGVESDFDLGIRNDPPTIGALEGINKWIGIASTDFANTNNWTLKVVPVAGEDVRFHASPYRNCILDADRTIGFYENSQSTYNFYLNGKTLTIQKDIKTSNGGYIDASTTAGSKVIFNGLGSQAISSGAFYNNQLNDLELNNGSGVVLNGGTIKIRGAYTKTNGLFDVKTNNTTVDFNGTVARSIPADIFSDNNTVYSLTISNTISVSLFGTLKVAGTLTGSSNKLDATTNSTTIEFIGATQTIPNNFFLNNTAYNITTSSTNAVVLGGVLTIQNELILNTGGLKINGKTLTLNGTITNTLTNGLYGATNSNLIIGGTASKTIQFNQAVLANYTILNMTINCSGNASLGSSNMLNITGTLTQTSGSISATDNNTIIFTKATAQTIPNNFFLDNKVSILKLSNTANVLLGGNLQVQGLIFNTNGKLNAQTNTITIEEGGTVTGATTARYIMGKCAKIGNTAFTFPVGGTKYGPVTITAPTNIDDIFTVSCIEANPTTIGSSKHFNVDELCTYRYWNIERTNGTSNVSITLPWETTTNMPFTDANIDRASVMHWSGTEWEYLPSSMTGNLAAGSTTTSENVSSFSPFTFGTRKTSLLPVEFVKMEMNCENDKPVLNWQTASETNNDYFEIQSSNDIKAWSKVAIIKGAGNSNQLINYSFSDVVNGLYYRIKQVDFNQKTAYSQPITSYCNSQLTNDNVAIYPNPTTGNISINITNNRINCRYSILDGIGKTVMAGNLSELSNAIDLTNLSNGIYFIKIDGFEKIEKISKQ